MSILVVCTGNICRSPMAEHLLRAALPGAVDVSSAGTQALVGEPMHAHSRRVLESYGLDGSAFRAQQLTAELVAGADLVLTATRAHRAVAVTLQPRAASYTFTIREFERLLATVDAGPLPELVAAAARQRGVSRPDRPEDDDVTDPYLGPLAGYVACAELLERSLARLVDRFRALPG